MKEGRSVDGVAVDLAPRGACTGRGMFASWKKTTSDGSSVLHTGIMLRLVGGGGGGGEGDMVGRCEKGREGETREGMWEGLGGQPARGHACVWSLCRKHTPADAGGVCRQSDGWAAGRYLHLEGNARLQCLSMEEAAFDSLTTYSGPARCRSCPAREYGLLGGSCQLCPTGCPLSP